VKVQKENAVRVEDEAVENAKSSMEKLNAAVVAAEAKTHASAETHASKKAATADAHALLVAKTELFKAACEAQQSGDAALESADAQRKQLQDAIDGPLRILSSGEEWEAASAAGHCKTLMALINKIGATDESLLVSVPACMNKAPADRGDFDKMVIASVEQSLKDKASERTATLEAGVAAKAERAAAVEAAQREVDTAQSARTEATDALSNAIAAEKEAIDTVQLAQAEAKSFTSQLEQVQAARDSKQAELDTFLKHTMARFTELEAKESAAQQAGA
jgi:hypothetical protein